MKIEMNTKEATKEELLHLSNLLLALAGETREKRSSTVQSDTSAGFMSMFGDNSQSSSHDSKNLSDSSNPIQVSSSVYGVASNSSPSQSGDVFSIFNDTPREEPKRDSNNSIRIVEY